VEARNEISDHKERDRTDDPTQQQSQHATPLVRVCLR
jgi:hypothetical protein